MSAVTELLELLLRAAEEGAVSAEELASKFEATPSMQGAVESLSDGTKFSLLDIFETEKVGEIFERDAENLIKYKAGQPLLKFKGGGVMTMVEHNARGVGGEIATKTLVEDSTSVLESLPERVESDLAELTRETIGEAAWNDLSKDSKQILKDTSDNFNKKYEELGGKAREAAKKDLENARDLQRDTSGKGTTVEPPKNPLKISDEELLQTTEAVENAGKTEKAESLLKRAANGVVNGVTKIFKISFVIGAGFGIAELYALIHEVAAAMSGCWLMRSDGRMWKIVPLTCGKEYKALPKVDGNGAIQAVPRTYGWGDTSNNGPSARPNDPNAWNPCPVNKYRYPRTAYCLPYAEKSAKTCGGIEDGGIDCSSETEGDSCNDTDQACPVCLSNKQLFITKSGISYSTVAFPGIGESNICRSSMLNINDIDKPSDCDDDDMCSKSCSNDTLYIPPDSNGMTYTVTCTRASFYDAFAEMLPDPLGGIEDLFGEVWKIIKNAIIIFVIIFLVIFFGKIIFNQLLKKKK